MARKYADGKFGYTLKEVAALTYLHTDDVLLLIGAGELDYFQHKVNSPQYVSRDSLDRYLAEHVDDIVDRKRRRIKKRSRL